MENNNLLQMNLSPQFSPRSLAEEISISHDEIAIVDDNPENLTVLGKMLRRQGYKVSTYYSGEMILEAIQDNPPALILLDVNMPGLDGYAVCERLKENATLSNIPVIFLSGVDETEGRVKAFSIGGVDYIAKPFQFEEVHARVETHLKIHRLQKALQEQNQRLEQTVAVRTNELEAANNRLTILDQSKTDFLSLISHEFRSPLIGLLGVGEILFEEVAAKGVKTQLRTMFEESRRRIMSILDDASLLTEIEINGLRFKSSPISLAMVLHHAIERASFFAGTRQVSIIAPPVHPDLVWGDADLLSKAFQRLLETAVKFSQEGDNIVISSDAKEEILKVTIETESGNIPDSALNRFFDVFSIGQAIIRGGDLGLASPVAHRIFSLFGGHVNVSNSPKSGINLTVALRNGTVGYRN